MIVRVCVRTSLTIDIYVAGCVDCWHVAHIILHACHCGYEDVKSSLTTDGTVITTGVKNCVDVHSSTQNDYTIDILTLIFKLSTILPFSLYYASTEWPCNAGDKVTVFCWPNSVATSGQLR